MLREIFEAGFLVTLFAIPSVTILLITQHLWPWETYTRNCLAIIALWVFAGGLSFWITGQEIAILTASLGITLSFLARRVLPDYYLAGPIVLTLATLGAIFGLGWGVSFITSLPVTLMTRALLLGNLGMVLFTTPLTLLTLLPAQSYLLRKRWHRPRQALLPSQRNLYPKVSFHVPCYAEPPEIVCATLDSLHRMRYPNFEVVVVDNNTLDPDLWRPVERHCAQLGSHFRFFHIAPLAGAKAGALNFALRHTATEAELIAVVDADYQAEPDFLEKLVGFFDDPTLGFVQTPHDYRRWQGNPYQQACYWEYLPYLRLGVTGLSEWVASFIIGTMCLVRRSALEEVGGWAEWCLTEDSECAVRLHALGYSSIFLPQTFGRGLIPETFEGYKKQRWRWTIGPIQQLNKHWRLYLPPPLATPSKLSFWQRLCEISHSLQGINLLITLIFLPVGCATLLSMLCHQEVIVIPPILWIATGVTLPAVLGIRWLSFRLAGCFTLKDMMGATIAALSLVHVRMVGVISVYLSSKLLKWHRTNKFKEGPNRWRALKTTQTECLLAVFCLVLSCSLALKASYTPPDLFFLVTLGLFTASLIYLTAPMMALLAEYQLQRQSCQSLPTHSTPYETKMRSERLSANK